jgi:lysophospholipase L1-like esterase
MRTKFKAIAAITLAGVIVPTAFAEPPAGRPDNAPPEGFAALFNGRDLSGWKGLVADPPKRDKMNASELAEAQKAADNQMRAHWVVQDGTLAYVGSGYDNLCSAEDYGDFELLADWKIAPGGDTGIYMRGSPQSNIWDTPEGSGGLFNNQVHEKHALIHADRAPGEWNTFHIFLVGDHATVYCNDLLVVDDTTLENYWERDKPLYPTGPIELQAHNSKVWFKNVYVRRLPHHDAIAAPVLKPGARVAICGDSITEQRLYSRFIEDYLLVCTPELDARIVQLGWSGERAPGFADRLENDLLWFKPTVVTLCYGMNDGLYKPYESATGKTYSDAMTRIVDRIKAAGALPVIGSPGVVDGVAFRRDNITPAVYNDTLARLRDLDRELALDKSAVFADVFDHMMLVMVKAKAAKGPEYDVAGTDGVHPRENGHLVMAYAFLKAMGLDGAIGTITLDMSGPATASDGHKILTSSAGRAEVRSSRYPFCFAGSDDSPGGLRGILPFVPFNDNLNRFRLVVKNAPAAAKVTWGSASKIFTKEQLAAGINLAAEFPDNPFSDAFAAVDKRVAEQEEFETGMIKRAVTQFRGARALLPSDHGLAAALDAARDRLAARDAELHAAAKAAVVPVRHVITVEPAP